MMMYNGTSALFLVRFIEIFIAVTLPVLYHHTEGSHISFSSCIVLIQQIVLLGNDKDSC